ncbi:hypothetical protein [Actinoallomurus iriomotensis]|uniref:PLD phosphodiesterase domain-containing protein n=1 Tax=Actinoallomurus iriomotensis TaxID=478107 RepID=A0A9W6W6L7_9ACTN|nr:hypothetical protein [Actinoallomurus iriomotensis]GLY92152.1 hypothetical protein Airi02_100800 [Actinoallomurus iriomotensis]
MTRWDMGRETLTTLTRRTHGSTEELRSLIQQLIRAAEPLEGRFDGNGKAMFDNFKAHADQISADLGRGLGSVNTGQAGMNKAFTHGDITMADDTRSLMGAANFDGAKFRG